MAKITLNQLARNLDRYADDLPAIASDVAVKAAKTIVADLVYYTRVDTSQALSNWQIGLGEANHNVIPPRSPGHAGSTQVQSAEATKQAADRVLANKKPGIATYISNAVPHIKYLDEGTAHISPQHFAARSVIIGRNVVRKYKVSRRG